MEKSLTIELALNKQKKLGVLCMCTKDIRTLLGIGTKIGTLRKLQVRNKNEKTRNSEQKLKNLERNSLNIKL